MTNGATEPGMRTTEHTSSTEQFREIELTRGINISKSLPDLDYILHSRIPTERYAAQKIFLKPREVKKRSKLRSRSNSSVETVPEMTVGKDNKRSLGKFMTFKF